MFVYVNIYIYRERDIHVYLSLSLYIYDTYTYIYIYIYILSSSRKPSGRLLMVSVVDIIQCVLFKWFPSSAVLWFPSSQENVFSWFPSLAFSWSPSWQENICYGFRRRNFDGFCRRRKIQNFRTYRVIPFWGIFRTGFRRGRKTLFYGFRRWFFNGFRRGKERLSMLSVVVSLWFPAATGPRLSLGWKS